MIYHLQMRVLIKKKEDIAKSLDSGRVHIPTYDDRPITTLAAFSTVFVAESRVGSNSWFVKQDWDTWWRSVTSFSWRPAKKYIKIEVLKENANYTKNSKNIQIVAAELLSANDP